VAALALLARRMRRKRPTTDFGKADARLSKRL
jgi:hypothetical protein